MRYAIVECIPDRSIAANHKFAWIIRDLTYVKAQDTLKLIIRQVNPHGGYMEIIEDSEQSFDEFKHAKSTLYEPLDVPFA